MFKETGKISQIIKDNLYIIRIFPNNQNCSSCNFKEKCKTNNKQFLELKGPEGLSKGDLVNIYLPQNSKSLFFFILFANPTIVLFVLIIILKNFIDSDNLTFLISSMVAIIDFIFSLFFLKRREKINFNKIKVVQIKKDKNQKEKYENY